MSRSGPRPEISYNTPLDSPCYKTWVNKDGGVRARSLVTNFIAWRAMAKPKATSTMPSKGGHYSQPTQYSFWQASRYASGGVQLDLPPQYVHWPWDLASVGTDGPGLTEINRPPSVVWNPPAWLSAYLINKALERLQHQPVHMGNFLGTADETAHMFQTTCQRIADGVRSFRKTRPRDFAKARATEGTPLWHKTPQSWLELQYGWNPLMADLDGMLHATESLNKTDPGFTQVKSQKKLSQTVVLNSNSSDGYYRQSYDVDAKVKLLLTYKLRSFILAELSSLGLLNPLEVVWERLPYSFVVDWFLPIGNWLQLLTADAGYDFLHGCKSTFFRYKEATIGYSPYDSVFIPRYWGNIRGEGVSFNREIVTSAPWPVLRFKSPVSAAHVANASSLLVTAFR